MPKVVHEPIHPAHHHDHQHQHHHHHVTQPNPQATPVANVEALVGRIQHEFPHAHIRVTGRGRTVARQAQLMAQRRMQNRQQFLTTYTAAPHITEMDQWVAAHPGVSEAEASTAFEGIINRARQNGAVVSNHLSDRARDVSIPAGTVAARNQIRQRIQELGGHVIDERDAVGGPHWHIDH